MKSLVLLASFASLAALAHAYDLAWWNSFFAPEPQKIPRLGACTLGATPCVDGLHCIHRKCVALGRRGDACGLDEHGTVCGQNLKCHRGRCISAPVVAAAGAVCNGGTIKCAAGFSCTDNDGKRRCLKVAGLGGSCAAQHTICSGRLVCRGGACSNPVVVAQPGKECNAGSVVCPATFGCVVAQGKRRCLKVGKLNDVCAPVANTVCPGELECRGGRCLKKITFADAGKACDDETVKCSAPLSCTGPAFGKRCLQVVGFGKGCSAANTVCNGALECRSGKCDMPLVTVGAGNACNNAFIKCGAGLTCIGAADAKKCLKVAKLHTSCSTANTVCSDGLQCRGGKCDVPIVSVEVGKACNGPLLKCAAGLQCLGATGKKKCLKVAKLSESCSAPHTVCPDNLECREGKCSLKIITVSAGAICNGDTTKCAAGLNCLGATGKKKCLKVAKLTQSCSAAHTVCDGDLECRGGKCAKKITIAGPGAVCDDVTVKCDAPLFSCVLSGGKKKCMKLMSLNQICTLPFTLCTSPLECRGGQCLPKIVNAAAGATCNGETIKCGTGFKCLESAGKKKCLKIAKLNGSCSLAHTICPDNLECRGGKCARKITTVAAGKACNGDTIKCGAGFQCFGAAGKKCLKVAKLSDSCSAPHTVCPDNLECREGKCSLKIITVSVGAACNGDTTKCVAGLNCLGAPGKKKCLKVAKLTQSCSAAHTVCDGDLECRGGKCAKKITIAAPGAVCDDVTVKCDAPLFSCVLSGGKKKCMKLMSLNQICTLPFTLCTSPLECRGGQCLPKIVNAAAGATCNGETIKCGAGLKCLISAGKKKCLKVAKLTQSCSAAHTVCDGDLECRGRKCAKKITTVAAGKTCNEETIKCGAGLSCFGAAGKKKCLKVAKLTESCSAAHTVCDGDLECRGGKCAKKITIAAPGAVCDDVTVKCDAPLFSCVLSGGKKKCMKLMSLNQICTLPFTLCTSPLECRGGQCLHKITTAAPGKECNGGTIKCGAGFECTEAAGKKLCLKVVGLSKICGLDHTICASNLVCTGGKCAQKVVLAEAGKTCNGQSVKCQHGFSCLTVDGKKKCGKLMESGGFCGLPWTVCKDGFECTDKKCAAPAPKVILADAGKACNGGTVKCQHGFKCLTAGSKKFCGKLFGAGGFCGLSWTVCEKGLKCTDTKCAAPALVAATTPKVTLVEAGKECNGGTVKCQHGFKCLTGGSKKFCGKLFGAGGFCGLSWTVCEKGLKCTDTKCVAPVPVAATPPKVALVEAGKGCNGGTVKCQHGFQCLTVNNTKICGKLFGAGGFCGLSWTVCEGALKCKNKVCGA